MDEALGEYGREYDAHGPNSYADRRGQSGYIVHKAPPGFDVDDGQNKAQIAAVEALPRAAIILFSRSFD